MNQKISDRFEELILLGTTVLNTRKSPSAGHFTSDFIDVQLASQWFVSSLSLLSRTIGNESEHYLAMKRLFVDYPKYPHVKQGYGVLLAAKDDVDRGALFDVKRLIEAEVFDDLLEQANALLVSGYFAPAAVVIGCVLEDTLRKLCVASSIEFESKVKLDAMNSSLAKKGVFNKLTQKKITALADIRNSAAHGKWDEFEIKDVDTMFVWVSDFIERYFSS